MRVHVWDGAQAVPSTPYVWDGAAPVTADMRAIPHGYSSVADMLSRDRFYWAHRCGSRDFPEFCLYGATRCADQGYGALEVSLNRTSDGVWFGLHDETLLRVSGVDIDPTTLTWQELSQYRINPPGTAPNQPSRPFMRVEEIIDSYGSSHVLVIDPKYRLNESSALFDLLLTMQPASRMVAKYAGNGRGLADIVRPKGIKSWGYYYGATWDANKQYASAWDLLGMEWNASQTVWDEVIAFGKPTIAHICATKAESDAGFAKGADGVQVSGVLSVLDRDDS